MNKVRSDCLKCQLKDGLHIDWNPWDSMLNMNDVQVLFLLQKRQKWSTFRKISWFNKIQGKNINFEYLFQILKKHCVLLSKYSFNAAWVKGSVKQTNKKLAKKYRDVKLIPCFRYWWWQLWEFTLPDQWIKLFKTFVLLFYLISITWSLDAGCLFRLLLFVQEWHLFYKWKVFVWNSTINLLECRRWTAHKYT